MAEWIDDPFGVETQETLLDGVFISNGEGGFDAAFVKLFWPLVIIVSKNVLIACSSGT